MRYSIGLYLSVPFCKRKCPYCDFYSVSSLIDKKIYLRCLQEELKRKGELLSELFSLKEISILTFYAGGGTPTLFSPRFYEELFKSFKPPFFFEPIELTLEANPENLSVEKLKEYKRIGFNRISLGIQTFQNKGLVFLGRGHTSKEGLLALENSLKAGFTNISLDFIYGWEGQTQKLLKQDLSLALSFEITHLSFYELTLYPNTPFYKLLEKRNSLLNTSQLINFQLLIKEELEKANFRRYEISNYAKEGYQCQHNLIYWELKPYLGIGAGAVSRIEKERFINHKLPYYIKNLLENKKIPPKKLEKLTPKRLAKEYLFMGLRLTKGISLEKLKTYGYTLRKKALQRLLLENYVSIIRDRVFLTENKGMFLYNQIVRYLWENLQKIK